MAEQDTEYIINRNSARLFRTWVDKIRKSPPSMTPYKDSALIALDKLLTENETITPEQSFWNHYILGSLSYDGFEALSSSNTDFSYPVDYGPHESQRCDRWYIQGVVYDTSGTLGHGYMNWTIWLARTTPGNTEETVAAATVLKSMCTVVWPEVGRTIEFPVRTHHLSEPGVVVSIAPFSIVMDHTYSARSSLDARLFPMDLDCSNQDESTYIRLRLEQIKSRWSNANVEHGIGYRAHGCTELEASGSFVMDGVPYDVIGSFSYRHVWVHGEEIVYFPDGFISQSISLIHMMVDDSPRMASHTVHTLFFDQGHQLHVYTNGSKVRQSTLSMQDGTHTTVNDMVVSELDYVDTRDPYPRRIRFESNMLKLSCEVKSNGEPLNRTTTQNEDRNIEQVLLIGPCEGTISGEPVTGRGVSCMDSRQTVTKRVAEAARIMGLDAGEVISVNMTEEEQDAAYARDYGVTEPTSSQRAYAVLFWTLPIIMLIVFIIVLAFLFKHVLAAK